MRMKAVFSATAALFIGLASVMQAQTPQPNQEVVVTRATGGSIQTRLSANIILNKQSSITREWLALHDPNMPADLIGTPGVSTTYTSGRVSGEYYYEAKPSVQAKEDLAAIEIRFLVFNVWGQHVRTLLSDEVADVAAGVTKELSPQWRVLSENEVSRHYASIGYISRIRTKDGRVVDADPTAIVREAQKFSKKFTVADLDPKESR